VRTLLSVTRFRPKEYLVPTSTQEAVKVLEEHGSKARILEGGTTFYELSMRGMMPEVEVIVDLNELKLDSVKVEGESVVVGSMVKLTDLLHTSVSKEPALQAIQDFLVKFTPIQIRNMATIGGEICAGVPFLDFPAIAIALGASFRVAGPKGNRTVAAENFFLDYFLVDLRRGEYLQEISIPTRRGTTTASAFVSLKRTSSDLSLVNAAVSLTLDRSGTCKEISVGLGGMGPIPLRGAAIEAALWQDD